MQKGDYTMTNEERESIRKYVLEVFHYEHQLSTTILAKLLNVVELLIDKGYINEYEAMACLSDVAIAKQMEDLNYGDNDWDESQIGV